MKILNVVIAKIWGGGEQYVYDISKNMTNRGIEVYIVIDKHAEVLEKKYSEVAKVITVNLYPVSGFLAIKDIKNIIKKYNVDYIFCHSGHAMVMCSLLKYITDTKLICFKHNAIRAKHDIYHKLQRKYTDVFICVSKFVYELQTDNVSFEYVGKYKLIYNGIDIEKFNTVISKRNLDNNFNIGYVGRLKKDKGIEVLIKAVSLLYKTRENIVLHIAGVDENGYKQCLEKLVEIEGIKNKVIFYGYIDNICEFYKKLDVLVLPSIVREAFGLTICEAMYCGIPVITTNSGAQSEIITNGEDGIIVEANDTNALKDAIIKIMDDNDSRNSISACGISRVKENFTINRCVDKLINVLKNIS